MYDHIDLIFVGPEQALPIVTALILWFGLAGLGFFSGIIRENYEFLPILYFTFSPMNFTTPPTSDAISKQKATMTPISPLKSTIAFRLTLPPPHF